jgi:hypothetical protein
VSGLASLVPAIAANPGLVQLNDVKIESAGVREHSLRVRQMTDPGYEMVFVDFKLRAKAHELTYLDLAENNLGNSAGKGHVLSPDEKESHVMSPDEAISPLLTIPPLTWTGFEGARP